MVDTISKIKPNVPMDIDAMPDDGALHKWIDKKKKQNELDGNALLPATVTAQLLNRFVGGGGLQNTGNTKEKAPLAQVAENSLFMDDRGLLRTAGSRVEEIAKEKGIARMTANTSAAPVMNSSSGAGVPAGQDAARSVTQTEPGATQVSAPARQNTERSVTVPWQGAENELRQSVSVKTVFRMTGVTSGESEVKGLNRDARIPENREDPADLQLTLLEGKTQVAVSSQRLEVSNQQSNQHSNQPTTQQQMKNQRVIQQTSGPTEQGVKHLEVDYPFRSWTGEHSVKVTVPTQLLREGNITLLPSDTRAADALSRHMSQLNGLTPELLRPDRDGDQQQQHKQQHSQQDEEQE